MVDLLRRTKRKVVNAVQAKEPSWGGGSGESHTFTFLVEHESQALRRRVLLSCEVPVSTRDGWAWRLPLMVWLSG